MLTNMNCSNVQTAWSALDQATGTDMRLGQAQHGSAIWPTCHAVGHSNFALSATHCSNVVCTTVCSTGHSHTRPSLAKLCPALTVLGPLGFHALHIMHRGLSHKLAIKASIKSPSTLFRACAASMMLTCHDLKHHRSVIHTERTPRHVNTIML
jgi:hypothetical protein